MNRTTFQTLRNALVAGVLIALGTSTATAQVARTARSLQFGVHVGGVLNAASSDFKVLPGVNSCIGEMDPTVAFDGGSGGGFAAGGVVGLTPLPTMDQGFLSHVGLNVKLDFASTTTTFETDERIGSASDPGGNLHSVISRYTIDAKVSELRVEPTAQYVIGPDMPLMLSLGAKLGFVMGSTYEHSETIASPTGASYADGSTARNATSGDIADVSAVQAGVLLGVGYDIALSQTMSLRPEISGALAVTSPVSGISWSPNEVRFGVSFLFTPAPDQSTPLQPTEEGGSTPR